MPVGDVMTVRIVSVAPHATVQEAITRMLEEGVGAVAVCDGPKLIGIFTERDVLRIAGEGPVFNELAVETVMTPRPLTISPEDDILAAAQLMADKRIRHLPVTQGEFLVGMVGIRDLMGRLVEEALRQDLRATETARSLLARPARV